MKQLVICGLVWFFLFVYLQPMGYGPRMQQASGQNQFLSQTQFPSQGMNVTNMPLAPPSGQAPVSQVCFFKMMVSVHVQAPRPQGTCVGQQHFFYLYVVSENCVQIPRLDRLGLVISKPLITVFMRNMAQKQSIVFFC